MLFPESVNEIVNAAAAKFPEDIEAATKQAHREVRKLPEYRSLVDDLVRTTLRSLICDSRHHTNCDIRKQNGDFHSTAKVSVGTSAACERAAETYFNYHIAGTVLGAILGENLLDIAKSERNRADGHRFNAKLCEQLRPLVPDGRTVRQAITQRKLNEIFKGLNARTKQVA